MDGNQARQDWAKWRWWCESREGKRGQRRILDTGKTQSNFLEFVRMIIIMFMDLVPGATGQLISSLSQQYSCHSLNECLLKIDDNGHMESLRAYLGNGSLEDNW